MDKRDNIKIFVAYHKDEQRIKSDILTPIHVGRSVASPEVTESLKDIIGDDTGDNISLKNPNYCELTALYWAWKNCDADYIGLFHYRRLLNLGASLSNCQIYNVEEQELQKYGITSQNIGKYCEKYDIILPPVFPTHIAGLPEDLLTNYEFYCKEHIKENLDTLIDVISQHFPEYIEDTRDYLNSKKSFFFNMFIMKREIYDAYMEWLFSVLQKVEEKIIIPDDSYQSRVFGFLAERLQNIFVNHLQRTRKDIKICYTNNVLYYSPCFKPVEFNRSLVQLGKFAYKNKTVSDNQTINLVFSVDNNYIKHCAVSLVSILLNSAKGNRFRVFILDGGLSEKNKKKFELLKEIREFELNFIKIDNNYFRDLPLNRSYISIATYYRLLLPEILPTDIDKVIYLDSDIVVVEDIANLWNVNLEDNFIAAVEDEGSLEQVKRLKLPAKNLYFNAGVCIFNIKKIREIDFQNIWKKYFEENKNRITLQDQDILNGVFNGKCRYVGLRWNANGRLYSNFNILEHAYSETEAEYAVHNPAIIHYTDKNKPWMKRCNHPLKKEYLRYLFFTPWKNEIVKLAVQMSVFKLPVLIRDNRKKIVSLRLNKKEKSLTLFGQRVFYRDGRL